MCLHENYSIRFWQGLDFLHPCFAYLGAYQLTSLAQNSLAPSENAFCELMGLSPSAEFSFVLKDSEQRAVTMLSISHAFVSSMFNQQGL